MRLGYRRPLEEEDLYLLNEEDESNAIAHVLDGYKDQVRAHLADSNNPEPQLFKVLMHHFGAYWIAGLVLYVVSIACGLLSPMFIQQALIYVQPVEQRTSADDLWLNSGLGISFILFGLQLGLTLSAKTAEQMLRKLMINGRSLLIGAVYEKSLRLSAAAAQKHSQGQIMTLINVDAGQVAATVLHGVPVVTAPIQIIVAVALLASSLGVATAAGVGLMVLFFFLQAPLVNAAQKSFGVVFAKADTRLKAVREALYSIKIVKLRAIEDFILPKIEAIRAEQTAALKSSYIAFAIFISLGLFTPLLLPIITFVVYSAIHGSLDPTKVFPALVLFQILFSPMMSLPQALSAVATARVSWKRITTLLAASEVAPLTASRASEGNGIAVKIIDATFRWEEEKDETKKSKKEKKIAKKAAEEAAKKEKEMDGVKTLEVEAAPTGIPPLFRDLNVSIRHGQLTAVVGSVGSGKSSFLSAIIGRMTKLKGQVDIYGNGKIALCEQQPWIQTATVSENITFGNPVDAARLQHVLRACSLEDDMRQLSAGLATEIGEKGINLSGGQKARVALARAIYEEDTEIFLLDDPISALDAHVGQEIFQRCIKEELAGKTRVLITHHLHLMPEVDHIIVLQEGRIAEEGSYAELMAAKGVMAELMKDHRENDNLNEEKKDDELKAEVHGPTSVSAAIAAADDSDDADPVGALMAVEGRAVGAVQWATYKAYIETAGGLKYALLLMLSVCAYNALEIMASYWLVWWTENRFSDWTTADYQIAYVGTGALAAVFIMLVNGIIMIGNFSVAKHIHRKALGNLLRAPLGFFETQPIGRMLNRFSKDVEQVDFELWNDVNITVFCMAAILSSLIVMAIVSPFTLCLFVPVCVGYWFILGYYRASFRELKRLDSVLRSPLYSHISETLTGLTTIRAYHAEGKFIDRQRVLMDKSTAPFYLKLTSAIWISLRLELSTSLIVLLLALLGTYGAISTSLLGLAFSYAIPLTMTINMVLTSFADLESDMNSIERLAEYAQDLPQEPPAIMPKDPDAAEWPTVGAIAFKNLELRYPSRPDHAVLRDLSLTIKPGEKIGIIGRTGSGKSTLLTALFRLVEPSKGSIVIDGRDIADLGLRTLRKGIQIIPQEPVLFQGTIRSNLDLEDKCADDQVWDTLERIGLKEYVAGLPAKLEAPVAVNGENLSQGQAQLMSLGRAILTKPKILVMDEATASVDAAADLLIQTSMKTHFSEATVLSIAHRLNTIIDFDRVLVLDNGSMREFDTPHALLNNPTSLFSKLADATGSANATHLRAVAAEAERARAGRA
ncbi:P-loop containing nucleoside triphosphate hydrolase protein [Fimicolochytrium jonesii]|uniref:P-loop containing nucleoside triphosphate hydrolase protein n=1 Tax=Fimicolochytrium jonesii TaxID=1396493 RepID=UPI0022FDE10D|nr:P-loop containing nucleoside triphosphate hydrolase protein [Fimicolochytrium jonesii]KAI8817409.1 P-loop containing nucleoside triphosphate hydrolase protein [Fimicolochytrium jonesii]